MTDIIDDIDLVIMVEPKITHEGLAVGKTLRDCKDEITRLSEQLADAEKVISDFDGWWTAEEFEDLAKYRNSYDEYRNKYGGGDGQ